MKKYLTIDKGYLYIPILIGGEEQTLEIKVREGGEWRKEFEFRIPIGVVEEGKYPYQYLAELPLREFIGRECLVEGEATESFMEELRISDKMPATGEERPAIHFSPQAGWGNDPNGMVFRDGLYHLYYQHNPFHVIWDNMSWGHAVSRDLLHWTQRDSVLFPDENGMMFSGCGLLNERGLLGLPRDAMLFFYTAAGGENEWSKGKEFTQDLAYSLDGSDTVRKAGPVIGALYRDSRDPKVFWHEETKAYVMTLWLRDNEFGVLRSEDLRNWKMTQKISLEDGWECPDLFCLRSDQGESCWFFWAAQGYYYPGEFDGYAFRPYGQKDCAYVTKLPYAAQTFSNTEDRVISIPWLRLENDGRTFTGSYGLPTELSFVWRDDRIVLMLKPVRELEEQMRPLREEELACKDGLVRYVSSAPGKALAVKMGWDPQDGETIECVINGMPFAFLPESGEILLDGGRERYLVGLGYREMFLVVDDRIVEIFFDQGMRMGTFDAKDFHVSFAMKEGMARKAQFYEIG